MYPTMAQIQALFNALFCLEIKLNLLLLFAAISTVEQGEVILQVRGLCDCEWLQESTVSLLSRVCMCIYFCISLMWFVGV